MPQKDASINSPGLIAVLWVFTPNNGLQHRESGNLRRAETTFVARRFIALAPGVVEVLHGIRGTQIEQRLGFGKLWENSGHVFTLIHGAPVAPDMLSKDFCAIVRKTGLPRLTLHRLRHAHTTMALTAGVDPKTISERSGHSSIATTMDVYSHVLPGIQEEAAQAAEDILSQARRAGRVRISYVRRSTKCPRR